MKSAEELRQILYRIDRKSYPAYKETKGSYQFDGFVLEIDHVQGDPFASPSKLHIEVAGKQAGFPVSLYDTKEKRVALQDHLTRLFAGMTEKYSFQAKGSGKSGLLLMTRCGQEVLERSACTLDEQNGSIVVRFEVGFPARGRTVQSGELVKILFEYLPICAEKALYYANLNQKAVQKVMELAVNQTYILNHLKERGLVAFVADGAILPRESGVSERPMKGAVAFQSPASMRVEFALPFGGVITGMGIGEGITLIVGGGYHGKSTLLKALERGVYPHISGDGREYVLTEADAVKIRAEDGRSIRHTDISLFINDLPNGKDTQAFYTEDASGSTSQAANVVEAMEAGSKLLLIDEDTSATNFMVRDELMQRVICRDMEPITPFIERMSAMRQEAGISTVLVAGSSGAYFYPADTILQMNHYIPEEITEKAKEIASQYPVPESGAEGVNLPQYQRVPKKNSGLAHKGRVKIKTMGRDAVSLNYETIDLRYVEQLADVEQLTSLGYIVKYLEERKMDGRKTIQELVEELAENMKRAGIEAFCEGERLPGNLALPRKQEIYACLNRYRGLKL